mmetsp:Transcript_52607/g.111729  ORF Transcript_52607/g.111729 Transcript_52607/m.111729 type:complete len:141 (-) Transcript_52607:238-660(-)
MTMTNNNNNSNVEDQQHRLMPQRESCRACLFTGVGTCMGLSGYFLYLAMEQEHKQNGFSRTKQHELSSQSHQYSEINGQQTKSKRRTKPQPVSKNRYYLSFETTLMKFTHCNQTPKRNRPFLIACSAMWAAAGAYRFYLN